MLPLGAMSESLILLQLRAMLMFTACVYLWSVLLPKAMLMPLGAM